MAKALKQRVYDNLNADESNRLGRSIDTAIIALIGISIVAVILESDREVAKEYHTAFTIFEWFSSITFSIEYILRVWTCTCEEKYAHPIKGRLRYMTSLMALIDLIAILPFYLTFIKGLDLRIVRAIRLFRLFRLFKIGRYAQSIAQLAGVFSSKKEELAITFFITMLMLIMASSIMFFAEHDAQPIKFRSIPAAMWWGVATLTTVGYGDVYPITAIGKFFGGVIALLGVGLVAMPAGIIAGGFNEAIETKKQKKKKEARDAANKDNDEEGQPGMGGGAAIVHSCPHCGEGIAISHVTLQPLDDNSLA